LYTLEVKGESEISTPWQRRGRALRDVGSGQVSELAGPSHHRTRRLRRAELDTLAEDQPDAGR